MFGIAGRLCIDGSDDQVLQVLQERRQAYELSPHFLTAPGLIVSRRTATSTGLAAIHLTLRNSGGVDSQWLTLVQVGQIEDGPITSETPPEQANIPRNDSHYPEMSLQDYPHIDLVCSLLGHGLMPQGCIGDDGIHALALSHLPNKVARWRLARIAYMIAYEYKLPNNEGKCWWGPVKQANHIRDVDLDVRNVASVGVVLKRSL